MFITPVFLKKLRFCSKTWFSLLLYISPPHGRLMHTVSYLDTAIGNNIIHTNKALEQTKFLEQ